MRTPRVLIVSAILLPLSRTAIAEEVTLPAPVLEWSFYILLIFAICVVLGISIFMRGKNSSDETLADLLDEQNPVIHSVRPEDSVTQCIRRMNELKIGAMLVMKENQLIGIFTERDAIIRVLGAGLDPLDTSVSSVMTTNPVWASHTTTLKEAMSIITNQRFRHLPVIKDGKVLGVVSSGDLTHHMVNEQQ